MEQLLMVASILDLKESLNRRKASEWEPIAMNSRSRLHPEYIFCRLLKRKGNQAPRMMVSFGKDIADLMKITPTTRVKVFGNKHNPHCFLLKKVEKGGYKIIQSSKSCSLHFSMPIETPPPGMLYAVTRAISFDIEDEETIIIDVSKIVDDQ